MRFSVTTICFLVLGSACAAGGAGPSTATPMACPPEPGPDATTRLASIFVDGLRRADSVPARLVRAAPESWEVIVWPRHLTLDRGATIDLVSFERGPAAERRYRLCPGFVAMHIRTRP